MGNKRVTWNKEKKKVNIRGENGCKPANNGKCNKSAYTIQDNNKEQEMEEKAEQVDTLRTDNTCIVLSQSNLTKQE